MRSSRIAASAVLLSLFVACGKAPEKSASAPAPTAVPRRAEPSVDAQDVASRQRRPPEGHAPVIWLGLDGLDWELLDRLSRVG